jgi:hypothetical protein
MNSVQESKNELEASIRYAEKAISVAKQTIESMEFRQEMAKQNYAEQTGREAALEREIANLKECLKIETAALDRLREDTPTMPVIPKDVAIAIFREGVQSGVVDAVSELEGQTIRVCENEYCGDFEVTFARDVHLDDELDLEWMRDNVGQYSEEFVVGALKGLCALKEFECRIHGVDDQEEKKND